MTEGVCAMVSQKSKTHSAREVRRQTMFSLGTLNEDNRAFTAAWDTG